MGGRPEVPEIGVVGGFQRQTHRWTQPGDPVWGRELVDQLAIPSELQSSSRTDPQFGRDAACAGPAWPGGDLRWARGGGDLATGRPSYGEA